MAVTSQACPSLDLSGKLCPQVVLEVAQAVQALPPGTELVVISTDPLSVIDIPLFARRAGHDLVTLPADCGVFRYQLTLGAAKIAP